MVYDDGTQGLVFVRSLSITKQRQFRNKSSVSDTFHFHKGCNLKLRSIHVPFDGTCHISVTKKAFDKSDVQIKVMSDAAASSENSSLVVDIGNSSTERIEITVKVSSGAGCGLSYRKSGKHYVWSGAQLYTTGKSTSLQSILV